ncbi:DUF2285 domain-containing protein [Sphingomonas sp. PL-96]|uniref:DNA -binding domain-containing protein n=1 Tax=Sphingomonas sp. PL-96 TaxID=2887201 RepID=UPI001E46B2BC|nr:DUF2285 domain-containing protein [Sphingomonas sp. PL-96]MCC2977137.1 DUF2285 domain-containing protein [Sphingomonas sp. PL-96]
MAASLKRDLPAATACRDLAGAAPADLAWEWLRRDPDYRRLASPARAPATGIVTIVDAAPPDCTARWGCLAMPSAGRPWMDTPLLWSADVDPSVLQVIALPLSDRAGAAFDLARCGVMATAVAGARCQHILLSNGAGSVRLDVLSGSLLDGPVSLVHVLPGMEESAPALAALRRFLHLRHAGRFPGLAARARQRLRRQVMALRAHDALAEGASIRDIGVMLFGRERVQDEWADEALKSQSRRLITLAREMAAGGYKALLRW